MKKMKFLTAGLIAAMMVPAAAQAQTLANALLRGVLGGVGGVVLVADA